ncbi:MAG: DUF2156 domain-containing protein [Clostridia bacterium]|nr:DUF2156 domain-containing protein [Clostridia bacterium]
MKFKKVDISDRDIILKYLKPGNIFGAHQSFTNMFIWQEGYNIEYCIKDGFFIEKSSFQSDVPFFIFPEGEGDLVSVLNSVSDYAQSKGCKLNFTQLSEKQADFLEKNFKGKFRFEESRSSAEYVYEVDKMINLPGKKLHAKRNFLNGFKASYDFEYRDITEDNIKEVKEFCLSLVENKEGRDDEIISIHKLFDNFKELKVAGAAIYIGGKVIAATVGEMLSPDTAVIHLEKADTSYRGGFVAISSMFLQNRFADVKYVNREEDMGIEGLRTAKMSYHPCRLVKKITAREI